MKGIVKWFDNRKGYGFIQSEDGAEIYVHYSNIAQEGFRALKHNQRVEFDQVTASDGRIEARNVIVCQKR